MRFVKEISFVGQAASLPWRCGQAGSLLYVARGSAALGALLVWVVFPGLVQADNWPSWRGPTGQGHSVEKNLPLKWSTTENVRWKTPLPADGNSSPIVWGDRIFLTQATAKGTQRSLMCFARADGKLLWQQGVVYKDKEPTHGNNPYCSASPVTDGERVIVSHGSAGMYCYDFAGKLLWRKDLGKLSHIWGNASSPIMYGDLAIIWAGPGDRQFLLAVDKKTGDKVWQHDESGGKSGPAQPYVGSWSTPIVVRIGGQDQLLLGVPERLKGFDLKTGQELWSCSGLHNAGKDELVYTSPVYADGIAVAMGGYGGAALAVRTGGQGDVTTSHRLWYHPRNSQRIGSPVMVGKHLYILNDNGVAQCLDPKTGKDLWKGQKISSSTWGSMVAADGRLYVTNRAGETLVLAASPKFALLATNALNEPVYGSIAISNGELFIRSYKHLWCIGAMK